MATKKKADSVDQAEPTFSKEQLVKSATLGLPRDAVAAILKYFGPAMLKEFEKRIALYGTLGIVALVGLVVALKMLT